MSLLQRGRSTNKTPECLISQWKTRWNIYMVMSPKHYLTGGSISSYWATFLFFSIYHHCSYIAMFWIELSEARLSFKIFIFVWNVRDFQFQSCTVIKLRKHSRLQRPFGLKYLFSCPKLRFKCWIKVEQIWLKMFCLTAMVIKTWAVCCVY